VEQTGDGMVTKEDRSMISPRWLVGGVFVLAACGSGSGPTDDGADAGRLDDASTTVDGPSGVDGGRTDGGTADGGTSTHPFDGGITPDAGHVMPPGTSNMGMNVPSLTYYNNAAIYADMALAIAGNNGPWDNGSAAAPLDAHGNPTVAATTGVSAAYPSGDYALSWDGTCTASPSAAAPTWGRWW
jgi:hypothetical protein